VSMGAPTPQELMMFVDGELDEARASEVAELVARDAALRAAVEGLALASELLREAALDRAAAAGADAIADSVMDSIEADAPRPSVVARRKIGPRPVAALGLALAAAAACILWMRTAGHRSIVASPDGSGAIAAVEVDRVDFGARAGSIFYVTTSADKGMTAVVWLTDDEPGSESGDKL
jgi:anti-sigma factor RsiW